jgi:hypothetical protein
VESLPARRAGAGVLTYSDGRVYDGEWKDNKYNGRGKTVAVWSGGTGRGGRVCWCERYRACEVGSQQGGIFGFWNILLREIWCARDGDGGVRWMSCRAVRVAENESHASWSSRHLHTVVIIQLGAHHDMRVCALLCIRASFLGSTVRVSMENDAPRCTTAALVL